MELNLLGGSLSEPDFVPAMLKNPSGGVIINISSECLPLLTRILLQRRQGGCQQLCNGGSAPGGIRR